MGRPAKGANETTQALGTKPTAERGEPWRKEHILAARGFPVAEIRTCTHGGGQERGGGRAPSLNKLISANVMFIEFVG